MLHCGLAVKVSKWPGAQDAPVVLSDSMQQQAQRAPSAALMPVKVATPFMYGVLMHFCRCLCVTFEPHVASLHSSTA